MEHNTMAQPPVPDPNLTRRRLRVNPYAASDGLPLNEAVKVEMASTPTKTPVSVLQELLSRRGIAPKYQLVQIEGPIHEPIFRYRVTVGNDYYVAMGTGRSKKEAKHAAAKALLDNIVGNGTEDGQNGNGNGGSPTALNAPVGDAQFPTDLYSEDKVVGNPIGWLQEMCMSRRWPPPSYDMESEEGLPHERMFTIACQVFKHRAVGSGKSKKLAKRQAAHKMWQMLQDLPLEGINLSNVDLEDELYQKIGKMSVRYTDLKDSKISTLTTSHSHKVSQFHKTLKLATGKKLTELQNTSLNNKTFNYVQFLQEIASEQQFEVTYVDIEEKSISEKCQCLVQLSTLPVAVCYGSGATSKDAQAAAAHNALEYLKIMTKK